MYRVDLRKIRLGQGGSEGKTRKPKVTRGAYGRILNRSRGLEEYFHATRGWKKW